jgi:hypothetical protein
MTKRQAKGIMPHQYVLYPAEYIFPAKKRNLAPINSTHKINFHFFMQGKNITIIFTGHYRYQPPRQQLKHMVHS